MNVIELPIDSLIPYERNPRKNDKAVEAVANSIKEFGIKVIPTLSWAEKETFKFCFLGIPKGSIVSISTIGVKENKDALKIWEDGVTEMIKQIRPSAILIYGGKLDYDYGDIDVIYYNNQVLERWQK